MNADQLELKSCLEKARGFHGDLCAGIVLGTRMAILGLKAIGIEDPCGKDRKNIVVYTEIDRCATDAILAVTGCHPGKRTMKILDYGKMAATFINLATGKAVRIVARDKQADPKKEYSPDMARQEPNTERYTSVPAEDLFEVREVEVDMRPEDMPGRPLRVVACSVCGEGILDMREIVKDGRTLCKPCAEGRTYWREKK